MQDTAPPRILCSRREMGSIIIATEVTDTPFFENVQYVRADIADAFLHAWIELRDNPDIQTNSSMIQLQANSALATAAVIRSE